MNETTTQRVLAHVFSLSLICQHRASEFLVSISDKLLFFIMPRGGRKGSGVKGRGKGKSDHPPPEHKDSAFDGAASND